MKNRYIFFWPRASNERYMTEKMLRHIPGGIFFAFFDTIFHKPISEIVKEADFACTTSKNGVRSLYLSGYHYQKKLWVVGEGSLACGRSLGYEKILSGGSDASQLIQKILNVEWEKKEKILYVRGDQVSNDLGHHLSSSGYPTNTFIGYTLTENSQAIDDFASKLSLLKPWAILLTSLRATFVFGRILRTSCPELRLCVFCLSERIARELNVYTGLTVFVSDEPTLESVLQLLEARRCL